MSNGFTDQCEYKDPEWLKESSNGNGDLSAAAHYKAALHPIGLLLVGGGPFSQKQKLVPLRNIPEAYSNGLDQQKLSQQAYQYDYQQPQQRQMRPQQQESVLQFPNQSQQQQRQSSDIILQTSKHSLIGKGSFNVLKFDSASRGNINSPGPNEILYSSYQHTFPVSNGVDGASSPSNSNNGSSNGDFNMRKSNYTSNDFNSPLTPQFMQPSVSQPPQAHNFQNIAITNSVVSPEKVTVHFHQDVTSIRFRKPKIKVNNVGPLTNALILQKDVYGRILFETMLKVRVGKHGIKDKGTVSGKQNHFKRPKNNANKWNLIKPQTEQEKVALYMLRAVEERKKGNSLELKYGTVNNTEALEKSILDVLPPMKIINMYVDRFFKYVHPFYPIIDEQSFRKDLHDLVIPSEDTDGGSDGSGSGSGDGGSVQVKLDLKTTFVDMAMLLLVLKIAYLTVHIYAADQSNESNEDVLLLLQYPMGALVLNFAKLCMTKYNFMRKSGLGILQVLFLFRVYNSLGYEEGNGLHNSESNILSGVIYQSAFFIGLNRDPENNLMAISSFDGDYHRVVQLWRKIWFCLVDLDTEAAMNCDAITTLDNKYSDTKYPDYTNFISGSNSQDLNIEKGIIDYFVEKNKLNTRVKSLLDKVLNINSPPTVQDINYDLHYIEGHFKGLPFSYDALINDFLHKKGSKLDYSGTTNLIRTYKDYFNLCQFTFMIRYHIFLEYENRGPMYEDQAWQEFLKITEKNIEFMMLLKFFNNLGRVYTENIYCYSYLFISSGMVSLHKYSQFFTSMIIRVIVTKYNLVKLNLLRSEAFEFLELLHKVFKKGVSFVSFICFMVDKHSNHFYSCHKSAIMLKYCLQFVSDQSNDFEFNLHSLARKCLADPNGSEMFGKDSKGYFSQSKLRDLLKIFQKYDDLTAKLEASCKSSNSSSLSSSTRKTLNSNTKRTNSIVSILNPLDPEPSPGIPDESTGFLPSQENMSSTFFTSADPVTINDVDLFWSYLNKRGSSKNTGERNKSKTQSNHSYTATGVEGATGADGSSSDGGANATSKSSSAASGKNVNASFDVNSFAIPDQYMFGMEEKLMLDDVLQINDEVLDLFGIEGLNTFN